MSAYRVHETDAAIRNLNDLLDVICDLQFEQSIDARDLRIDSLLWIARDLSDGVVRSLNETPTDEQRRFDA